MFRLRVASELQELARLQHEFEERGPRLKNWVVAATCRVGGWDFFPLIMQRWSAIQGDRRRQRRLLSTRLRPGKHWPTPLELGLVPKPFESEPIPRPPQALHNHAQRPETPRSSLRGAALLIQELEKKAKKAAAEEEGRTLGLGSF